MSAKFPRGGGEQTHSQPSVYYEVSSKYRVQAQISTFYKSFCIFYTDNLAVEVDECSVLESIQILSHEL